MSSSHIHWRGHCMRCWKLTPLTCSHTVHTGANTRLSSMQTHASFMPHNAECCSTHTHTCALLVGTSTCSCVAPFVRAQAHDRLGNLCGSTYLPRLHPVLFKPTCHCRSCLRHLSCTWCDCIAAVVQPRLLCRRLNPDADNAKHIRCKKRYTHKGMMTTCSDAAGFVLS